MNAPTTKRLNWKGKLVIFAALALLWYWAMLCSASKFDRQIRGNADFVRELEHGTVEQAARNLRR